MSEQPQPAPAGHSPGGDRLVLWILLGIVIGALLGGLSPTGGSAVQFIGDLFLQALKMIIVPLVTLSITVGITGLGDVRRLGTIGWRTIAYYLTTTTLAVITGLVLVSLIHPGIGADTAGATLAEAVRGKEGATPAETIRQVLAGLLPANVIAAAAETEVLPLIVFSLFFGGVLTTFGERARPLISLLELGNDVVMRMVHVIMRFAPLGIGCLVAGRLAQANGFAGFLPELAKVGRYSLTVLLGLSIHGLLTLPLLLVFLGRRSMKHYAIAVSEALATAFGTASSSATLPLTVECTTEKGGVSSRTASFVLPLGATINMDGTALYEAVAAVFIAEAFGVHLDPAALVVVALTATLASIGAAGIPEAGLVTMVIVLKAVDLPIEGISIILLVDWFLDRCRTTINVWGDSVGAAIIDRFETPGGLTAAPGDR